MDGREVDLRRDRQQRRPICRMVVGTKGREFFRG
jgi:hypothetical protein